jgi:hypothetical protein
MGRPTPGAMSPLYCFRHRFLPIVSFPNREHRRSMEHSNGLSGSRSDFAPRSASGPRPNDICHPADPLCFDTGPTAFVCRHHFSSSRFPNKAKIISRCTRHFVAGWRPRPKSQAGHPSSCTELCAPSNTSRPTSRSRQRSLILFPWWEWGSLLIAQIFCLFSRLSVGTAGDGPC